MHSCVRILTRTRLCPTNPQSDTVVSGFSLRHGCVRILPPSLGHGCVRILTRTRLCLNYCSDTVVSESSLARTRLCLNHPSVTAVSSPHSDTVVSDTVVSGFSLRHGCVRILTRTHSCLNYHSDTYSCVRILDRTRLCPNIPSLGHGFV